jgi:hypothetical protein
MFRAVPLPIIRSFPLYIRHWYMSCKVCWHIPVPNVQWKTPDDGQRNCPKLIEFLNKNKLVRLLVLLKRKYLDCLIPQNVITSPETSVTAPTEIAQHPGRVKTSVVLWRQPKISPSTETLSRPYFWTPLEITVFLCSIFMFIMYA